MTSGPLPNSSVAFLLQPTIRCRLHHHLPTAALSRLLSRPSPRPSPERPPAPLYATLPASPHSPWRVHARTSSSSIGAPAMAEPAGPPRVPQSSAKSPAAPRPTAPWLLPYACTAPAACLPPRATADYPRSPKSPSPSMRRRRPTSSPAPHGLWS